jgi:hypothetical protein
MIKIDPFKILDNSHTHTSEIKISYITDNPNIKVVSAFILGKGLVILWEGTAYDEIGQWTDVDVTNKLHELFPN